MKRFGLPMEAALLLAPLIAGGGQERGLRSGTENVAAIVGFGVACERALARQADEAVRLAEKLRARVAELPFAGVGGVTISLGAAELQPDETIDSLFKRVDTALYEAKAAGRNATRVARVRA